MLHIELKFWHCIFYIIQHETTTISRSCSDLGSSIAKESVEPRNLSYKMNTYLSCDIEDAIEKWILKPVDFLPNLACQNCKCNFFL